nr:MAG TPA: hypothetical protein [Caudoviricetes sp.]
MIHNKKNNEEQIKSFTYKIFLSLYHYFIHFITLSL